MSGLAWLVKIEHPEQTVAPARTAPLVRIKERLSPTLDCDIGNSLGTVPQNRDLAFLLRAQCVPPLRVVYIIRP